MYKEVRPKNKKYYKPRNGSNNNGRSRMDVHKFINQQMMTLPPKPYEQVHGFDDFAIHDTLKHRISGSRYLIPTEIQDKTIPHILSGKDLIGIAGTGTGKTAAFLIPIIQRLIEKPEKDLALVITPTRELASQIMDEFRKLTSGLNLYATTLIGGVDVNRSIKDLRRINHLIVATPGRLIDIVDRGHVLLNNFKILVLDEFDRMLDMGFLPDVKMINNQMRGEKQTLLFSATMDESQKVIVNSMTRSPMKVTASSGKQLTHAIEQDVLYVGKDRNKNEVLYDLISEYKHHKVLLFCETKRKVIKVNKILQQDKIQSDMIHGDKTQRSREIALKKFRKGQIQVLVATNVVARGIDVSNVSLVINYEVPRDYIDYIHRIGRTGRAGKTGKAITLID
jgi:ATP-dependent RNA helicase RhlE